MTAPTPRRAMLAALAIVVAACASDDGDAEPPADQTAVTAATSLPATVAPSVAPEPAATEPANTEPATTEPPASTVAPEPTNRQVETDYGTFEVPAEPERLIVTDSRSALPTVLDLGVEVYGTWDPFNVGRPEGTLVTDEEWNSLAFIGSGGANVELLAAADPDLVLHTLLEPGDAEIDLITAFAPMVPLEVSLDWKSDAQDVAEAVDREDELAALLDDYRDRADALAARIDDEIGDPTIAVVRVRPDSIRVHTNLHFSGELLGDAGLRVPEEFEYEPAADRLDSTLLVPLSPELLELIEPADYVFVMAVGTAVQSQEDVAASLDELQDNPLWQRLSAVEAGRSAVVGDHWFVGSLRAANAALDDLERILFGDT